MIFDEKVEFLIDFYTVEPLSCDPLFSELEEENKIYKTEFFPISLRVKFPLSCELKVVKILTSELFLSNKIFNFLYFQQNISSFK